MLFLTDVPSYCKYAYLIVVFTETGWRYGTTSNIMIKLIGTASSSKASTI